MFVIKTVQNPFKNFLFLYFNYLFLCFNFLYLFLFSNFLFLYFNFLFLCFYYFDFRQSVEELFPRAIMQMFDTGLEPMTSVVGGLRLDD